jgi:hypothetical protein
VVAPLRFQPFGGAAVITFRLRVILRTRSRAGRLFCEVQTGSIAAISFRARSSAKLWNWAYLCGREHEFHVAQRLWRRTLGGQRESLSRQFNEDETAVLVEYPSPVFSLPRYVLTFGLWERWRRRHQYLVTNHRVIVSKGLVAPRQWSLELEKIVKVTVDREFWISNITIFAAEGPMISMRMLFLSHGQLGRLEKALTSARDYCEK